MKYILLSILIFISSFAGFAQKNIAIKDKKELESLFTKQNNIQKLSYGKMISNATLAGRLDRTVMPNHKPFRQEWVIILFDGTQVYLGKNNLDTLPLPNLYKHIVQIQGSILDGSIDVYTDSPGFESRGGYRIDVKKILDLNFGIFESKTELEILLSLSPSSKNNKVILEGTLNQRNFITKKNTIAGKEWILTLTDQTEILLGKRNLDQYNLNDFLHTKVEITGYIKYGNIDIYDEKENDIQSRSGYRIDVEKIRKTYVKAAIVSDYSWLNDIQPIILKINDIKREGAIGYASVYKCNISKVLQGSLKDTSILITILTNKKIRKKFSLIEQLKAPLTLTFNKYHDNEDYSFTIVNGFVDSNKTSWEIVEVQPSN